ncbi:MAG TPA: zf-HC2 domain-containing protein [Terriglobales bacterium]|nr:zf-HC2 domain-containing protein [Terriglobales bacterium]
MKCANVQDSLVLLLYGELPDDSRFQVQKHLDDCAECAQEWQDLRQFHTDANAVPALDPTPNLLASSRMRLHDALDTTEQVRGWRFIFDPSAWLRQMQFSPALAAAILMVGFTAGGLTVWDIAHKSGAGPIPTIDQSNPSQAAIAGISGITQDPTNNKVQIKYDTLQPQSTEGSLDDANIQQLLLYAARNQQNPGVRVESMDLLTKRCGDPRVREALIYALRYDKNPGVRLKAVDGLKPYVKDDIRVRDAVIEALLYDANQGVRVEAIHMLQPVRADGSVRSALRQLAVKDPNPFIKRESGRMLAAEANIN